MPPRSNLEQATEPSTGRRQARVSRAHRYEAVTDQPRIRAVTRRYDADDRRVPRLGEVERVERRHQHQSARLPVRSRRPLHGRARRRGRRVHACWPDDAVRGATTATCHRPPSPSGSRCQCAPRAVPSQRRGRNPHARRRGLPGSRDGTPPGHRHLLRRRLRRRRRGLVRVRLPHRRGAPGGERPRALGRHAAAGAAYGGDHDLLGHRLDRGRRPGGRLRARAGRASTRSSTPRRSPR